MQTGYTALMLKTLEKPCNIFVDGGVRSVKTPSSAVVDTCFERMQNWLELVRMTVRAEMPHFESLQLFRIFSLDATPNMEDAKRLANLLDLDAECFCQRFLDMRPSAEYFTKSLVKRRAVHGVQLIWGAGTIQFRDAVCGTTAKTQNLSHNKRTKSGCFLHYQAARSLQGNVCIGGHSIEPFMVFRQFLFDLTLEFLYLRPQQPLLVRAPALVVGQNIKLRHDDAVDWERRSRFAP